MSLTEHLEKLRYFNKLTKFRSITEGSQAIGISQAGLSKSISTLEDILGVTLFVRSNQGLVLTKEGQLALEVSTSIISQAESLELKLRSLKSVKVPKQLKIGMYDSVAVYFFNELMQYIQEIYKDLEVRLLVDTSKNLAQAIKSKDIDIAIGVNLTNQPNKDSEYFLLFEDQYSFYISEKMEADVSAPLLLHPFSTDANGNTLEHLLKKLILKNGVHYILNFETLKTLAVQGLGIGVLPNQVARPLVERRQLAPILLPNVKRMFGRHNIGFQASKEFLADHRDFAQDLYRLGQRWSRS